MDTTGTLFMPPGQSTIAPEVDALFNFILYVATIFFVIVVAGMTYFVIKYRRRDTDAGPTPGLAHNTTLEIIWTVIPTILVIIVFFWGFRVFMKMHLPPKDAYEIKVTGQKWFWSFDYPNGATAINELIVPAGKPVRLLMSSKDVIHSFFVPDFRIKMDVLPNRYTVTWFEAPNAGIYNLFCAEYCGTSHSQMIGKVKVVEQKEFAAWLEKGESAGEGVTPEKYGEQLYMSKACNTCHRLDGTAFTGPTFKGLFGKVEKMTNGETITVDENYLRESILTPPAKIVVGYQPVMPTYQGLLTNRQIDAIIAYIKTLK